MSRLRTPLLGLLASVLLSACTLVPTDPSPRSVNSADVPSGLLNGGGAKKSATVAFWYFDAEGRLVKRWERISTPVTIAALLTHLTQRVPSGLTTALPTKIALTRAVVRGDEVTLFISAGFRGVDPETEMAAMRQMVATLRDTFGISTLNVNDVERGRTLFVDAPAP
ncbi:unannotated protein [freshwater metagenome]|uniref:Unannotated protein n=1 Tax=freshwater metagenome TaxID=449393 RepID=A0A6J7DNX4_9ZZZZ|nr:GerMN domain-containing protein [Actinomycetota bacterium]MUH58301.1 hypothetical protein [Actinomycetota bacterium]